MEELKQIIEKLPKKVKGALYSDEYLTKFNSIAQKHGLNTEQSGILMEELVYVMAGITHPNDFVDEIKKELELSEEKSIDITKDINSEILNEIKEILINSYENEDFINDEEDENSIERDQLLKDIEDPTTPVKQISPEKPTVLEDKLGGPVKLNSEKKVIEDEDNTKSWKQPLDPYREPFE